MRRALRPGLTTTVGTVVVLVAGGGVWAYAGWVSRTTSTVFTIRAARIPQMPRPTVTVTVVPIIRWQPVQISRVTPVHQYVVSRHGSGPTQIVCTRPAPASRCLDLTFRPGEKVTYTVHATYGTHWIGQESDASTGLTLPGFSFQGSSAAPQLVDPSTDPSAPAVDAPFAVPDALLPTETPAPPSPSLAEPTTSPPSPPSPSPSPSPSLETTRAPTVSPSG